MILTYTTYITLTEIGGGECSALDKGEKNSL